MRTFRSLGVAILVAAASSASSFAGAAESLTAPSTPPDSAIANPSDSTSAIADSAALTAAFAPLRKGMLVRVLVPEMRILEGPFLRAHDGRLLFDDVKDTAVAFDDIDQVWRHKRGRSEAGMVGGIYLGLLGAVSFASVGYSGLCWYYCGPRSDAEVALATIGGAIIGAGIGFVIGHVLGRLVAPGPMIWAEIYPAQPAVPGGWSPPVPDPR